MIYCNTRFKDITFVGDCTGTKNDDTQSTDYSKFMTKKIYTISNAGTNMVTFENCTFKHHSSFCTGSNFNFTGGNSFECCGNIGDFGIGPRINVEGNFTAKNCIEGFNMNASAIRLWTFNETTPVIFTIENVNSFLTGIANGNILMQIQYPIKTVDGNSTKIDLKGSNKLDDNLPKNANSIVKNAVAKLTGLSV